MENPQQVLTVLNAGIFELRPDLRNWITDHVSLNKFIILSDLPVHKEQIAGNVAFFDPFNATELAEKIIAQIKHPASVVITDYKENIRKYGREILSALTDNTSTT